MTSETNLKQNHSLYNGRPTIGVLIGSMSSTYQEGIMRGATAAAKEYDYNVIGFSGGPINSPDPLAQSRETLFDLVNTDLIDGIIIPLSSHTRYLTDQETDAFIHQFSSIPIINIGSQIEGHTNLVTDYRHGLEQLIHHYVVDHNYKKIALLRGPDHHASSTIRQKIYKEILEKHNLPYDESLVIYGDLRRNSAKKAVNELLDTRKQTCDAIIAVNDNQALGIIETLKERGISVPNDIAVCGSLGVPEGMFSEPQLTTIKEPLFELGFQAIVAMSEEMNQCSEKNLISIPTELLIRESCGCEKTIVKNNFAYDIANHSSIVDETAIDEILFSETESLCKRIIEKNRSTISSNEVGDLLILYKKAISLGQQTAFFEKLSIQLELALKSPEIIPWLEVTSAMHYSAVEFAKIKGDNELFTFIHTIESYKENISNKAVIYQGFETDFYINFFREIVNNLNSSFDLNAVGTYAFRLLDLTELYINVYEPDTSLLKATNIMAVRDNTRITVSESHRTFDANNILPSSIAKYEDRYTLIIFPLSFRKKPLGFLMVNLSERKGSAYENMQAIISTALKNELQIQELKDAEERFSDIAHSTSDWLWETDTDNQFTYSSASVKEVVGFTSDEILGHSIQENTLADSNTYLESMKLKQPFSNIESWMYDKNRRLVCLLISATPIFKDEQFVGYRGVFKDVTDQKLQEEKIKNLAFYDNLTGLPNRTFFKDTLKETIDQASKHSRSFALMFIDLDRFKYINDSLGHAAGDQLLEKITARLKEAIRPSDTLARLGGDEFTIILPDIYNENEVIQMAKKIISITAPSLKILDQKIFVTLSIGIAMFPSDGIDSSTLLKNADTAMYRAKSKGRNRYIFYDYHLEKKNASRIRYESLLYNALETDFFYVEYQPKVCSKSLKACSYEALVRIYDPKLGHVPPNEFIPIAEELGLIGRIDEWVFREVCRQHNVWTSQGFTDVKIAVNISAIQLKNLSVVQRYLSIVNEIAIEPSHIQLEITENALIDNEEVALKILTAFKEIGFTIALDDFGTGYSSLSSISKYPIDTVKIDRSFIKNLSKSATNRTLVTAIVQMAKTLNLSVVAEGVENRYQYDLVTEIGCDDIQGYYFSKPVQSDLITKYLQSNHKFNVNSSKPIRATFYLTKKSIKTLIRIVAKYITPMKTKFLTAIIKVSAFD